MIYKAGDPCPNCKVGKLVIKDGKYSEFLGCDMYHHTRCMFVGKIAKGENDDALERRADDILIENGIEVLKIR